MFQRWRQKRQNRDVVNGIYETVVARARRPELYVEGAIPDTVLGRYEALGIEVLLLLDRCRDDARLQALSQDLVDRFMLDVDHSLREIGIGYQGIPRRMRKLASRFYTRVGEYKAPLAARDEPALARALERRIFSAGEAPDGAPAFIARDMVARARHYETIGADDILAGRLDGQGEARDER